MKICRFQSKNAGAEAAKYSGIIEGDRVRETASLFEPKKRLDRTWPLSEIRLLAPSEPSKIVCVGRNYAAHAAELGNDVPKEPLIFLKPPSAILAPEEPIVLTPYSQRVDHEGELAIIIGRRCGHFPEAEPVSMYILGYTCLNDVTARDLQKKDVQYTRAKGFDTFCPFGPWIETDLDLSRARVETFVNGSRRQSAPVTDMIFSVETIVRWISQMMTLEPGDVIATGTPSGIGPLAAGDVVEVSIAGIGALRNPVAKPR